MTTQFFVYLSFAIIDTVILIILSYVYLQYLFPIHAFLRSRRWLSLFFAWILHIYVLLSLFEVMWPEFSCIFTIFSRFSCSLFVINIYLLRYWILWSDFRSSEAKIRALREQSYIEDNNILFSNIKIQGFSGSGWFARHRYTRRITFLLIFFSIFCIIDIIPIIILSFYSDISCSDTGLFYFDITLTISWAIFFTLSLLFIALVRGREENFSFKEELLYCGICMFICIASVIIFRIFISKEYSYIGIIILSILAIPIYILTLLYPAYKIYNINQHISNTTISKPFAAFMENPRCLSRFKQFLAREFSIETLLFVLDVDNLYRKIKNTLITQSDKEQLPDDGLAALTSAISKTYFNIDSLYELTTLSKKTIQIERNKILELNMMVRASYCTEFEYASEIQVRDLFHGVRREIWRMLEDGPYMRLIVQNPAEYSHLITNEIDNNDERRKSVAQSLNVTSSSIQLSQI